MNAVTEIGSERSVPTGKYFDTKYYSNSIASCVFYIPTLPAIPAKFQFDELSSSLSLSFRRFSHGTRGLLCLEEESCS